MKSFLCSDLLFCFIVVVAVFFGCTEADITEQGKIRRGGGTLGLIAFPRVGRSDPSMMNNLHENLETSSFDSLTYPASLEDYDDFAINEIKRASLKPFPRIGRAGDTEMRKWAHLLALQQALDKRAGPSATSGLWFGPRLGKRSVDSHTKQHVPKSQKELY